MYRYFRTGQYKNKKPPELIFQAVFYFVQHWLYQLLFRFQAS